MKFCICNDVYTDWKITDSMAHAAHAGYEAMELAPFTLTDDVAHWPVGDQKEIRRCADDHGLELVGLHWLLVTPDGLHVNSRDVSVRRRTADFFRKLIEIAVNTDARVLTLGSPKQRSFGDDDTHADALARTAAFFAELVPEFESARVTLALEPLEADLTNVFTRTQETRELADRVGSSSIGITLDTHFLRWEEEAHGVTVAQAFEQAGTRLAHLHIQDDNDGAPGSGSADFTGYADQVRQMGWQGAISLETFPRDDLPPPDRTAEATLRFFERTFPENGRG